MNEKSQFPCPSCQRSLYDRTRKTCGYCGAVIPEALRFTKTMIADLDGGRYTDKDNLVIRPDDGADIF